MPVTPDPGAVTRHVLANGLTVLVYHNPAAPVVAVNTYVRAGYFDETDDVVGIAHVLEHMYFKGTERFGVGEIARATKAAGGYLNAHTIYDHTSYYAVLPSSGFVEGLTVQADAYARSVIDAGELGRELEVIIQEARRKADNPAAVAAESLNALLFDRHRIRRWRIGTAEGLRRLTRDDVVRFYRNFYTPSNTILAIAGDVDPDAALRAVDDCYGALPAGTPVRHPGPAEPEHAGFRYRALAGDVTQTTLEIGWRTVPVMHPDAPALDLAASILGTGRASRLYRAVRDRRLAGAVGASHYTPTEVGIFSVSSEGEPQTARGAARAMWAQLRSLRGAVGAGEVERAQRLADARLARRLETTEGQAAYLVEWEAVGGWEEGRRYHEAFLRLDPSDVIRVARHYLTGERAGVVEYRPDGTAPLGATAEDVRALLDGASDDPLAGGPRIVISPPAPRAGAVREAMVAGVHVYRTSAGLPILVRPTAPGAPLAHVAIIAGRGAAHEPPRHAGITALAARAAARHTATRTALEIAETAELLGGSVAASTASESFGWSISVPTPNAGRALALLADVVQHATLPDEAIATERAALLADAAAVRDDMYRYPMRLLQRAAFDGHPYATPVAGDEASLERLTPPVVRAWFDAAMRAAPYVAAVVADGDPDELAGAVAGALSELVPGAAPPDPPVAWPAAVRVEIEPRAKAQTALALAFPGPTRLDPSRYAARVLATIASGLGGRLFEELRDRRSLAYTVHAFASELHHAGMFAAYIATAPASEAAARDGLLAELGRFRAEPVTRDELHRAQRYLLGMHDIRLERGSAVLGDVIDGWLAGGIDGLAELERVRERIAAVSADAVQRLATAHFDPARYVEGVVRGGVVATADAPEPVTA